MEYNFWNLSSNTTSFCNPYNPNFTKIQMELLLHISSKRNCHAIGWPMNDQPITNVCYKTIRQGYMYSPLIDDE